MTRYNILSLFDGGGTGHYVLKKIGFPIRNYFASEIDRHAITAAKCNNPETVHIGDVSKITAQSLPLIDILIGGSPCQGFSMSGKQLNFNDPRSVLFFDYVHLLKECNPKYFMLENVVMKQEYSDIISEYLGTTPIRLNSSYTSAQNRERLYWANFPITAPENKNINLVDILETKEMCNPAAIRGRKLLGDSFYTQQLEVKDSTKMNCLTTVKKDTVLTNLSHGKYVPDYAFRHLTITERCRLMNLPDNYCKSISDSQAVKLTGNGWDAGMVEHIFNCLMKHIHDNNHEKT